MENIVENNEKSSVSPAKILPAVLSNENGNNVDDEPMPDVQQEMMLDGIDEDEEEEEELGAAGSNPKYLTRHFIKKISPMNNSKKNTPEVCTTIKIVREAMEAPKITPKPPATAVEGTPIIKVQKKRGRKKKIISNEQLQLQPAEIQRRKRGRPRKVPITDIDNNTSSSQSELTSSSTEAIPANNFTPMETSKKLGISSANQQKQQSQLAPSPTTTTANSNNKNHNLPSHNFNIGVAAHYWAEFPIPFQNPTTTTTAKDRGNKEAEATEEDDANKLPRKLSKKELDAIRFAGINPLIVLCEAATRQQQEQANGTGGAKIALQNGHDYGQQDGRDSSNSSDSTTAIKSPDNNIRRHKWTDNDSWGMKLGQHNFVVMGDGERAIGNVTTASNTPHPLPNYIPQIFDPAPSTEEATVQIMGRPFPSTSSAYPPNASDIGGSGCCSSAASNDDDDELACQYRIRTMSSIEARDHLTIACLNALCNGEKLARMRVVNKNRSAKNQEVNNGRRMSNNGGAEEDDDVPFNFSLPRACLKMLTPVTIESLVEVVYEWINHHWIRTIDGRLGDELRQFSRIDQMRWILMYAVPELCIYYLKKANKISVDEAKQQFLAMESTTTAKFN